ncbi:sensor histidine kinase [Rhodococcus sp. ARC_M6]|uniref:sensor histidine kinase n=1 Tax=Rhodococcus sp. ARC_M6 TaxID=2928852 RepID=UPI001FB1C369|nr:sensor histidine kinase [Rhodococcus sp. ARC_M6]MCJ0906699.1 sensor histidine kinase [Rhodococcus sp. ARC_M6]
MTSSTAIDETVNDEAESKTEWGWWGSAQGSQLSYVGRAGVLLVGVLSLVYLVAAMLSGDSLPKNSESQIDYGQLLGPMLVIAINTIALAKARYNPIFFFSVSVFAMIVLALVLGDRAAAATPLYWISILMLAIGTEGRSFYLPVLVGISADLLVSIHLRMSDLNLPLSLDTFGELVVPVIVNVVMSYGLFTALGKVVQNQRRHKLVDGVRIRQLKQERDMAVQKAVADERNRMARELHDVSAHHLTAVIIQGKAAAEIFETAPGEVQDLLFGVVDQGERALRSLRQLVEVLRIGPTESQSPQPSIQSVMSLVDGCQRSGLTVTADIGGDLVDIDSAIQVSCYRIVQESLSNVLRHAYGSRVVVLIRQDSGSLKIIVENDVGVSLEGDMNGQGLGLVGLRERTEYLGGSFEAGPSGAGRWKVQAEIPLEGLNG